MSKLHDYTAVPLSARIAIYRLLLNSPDSLTAHTISKEVGVLSGAWLDAVANRPLKDDLNEPTDTKYIRRGVLSRGKSGRAHYAYYIPPGFKAQVRTLIELYERQQAASNFCYQHEDTGVSGCPSDQAVEGHEFELSGHYSGMPFDQLVYSALELETHQRKLLVRILSSGE